MEHPDLNRVVPTRERIAEALDCIRRVAKEIEVFGVAPHVRTMIDREILHPDHEWRNGGTLNAWYSALVATGDPDRVTRGRLVQLMQLVGAMMRDDAAPPNAPAIMREAADMLSEAAGIGQATPVDELHGFLPASALATEFGLDLEATEKKLARFRAKHLSSDYWIQNADVSTQNAPRYFYNVARVRDTLLKKRPSNVPQKKSSRGKPQ